MSKLKVNTPEFEPDSKKVKALAGCMMTIVGLVLVSFIAYASYILFTT